MATGRDDFSNQLLNMNSEKFAVVFDTNSYRNLIHDTSIEDIEAGIAKLKEKEARKNIMSKATLRRLLRLKKYILRKLIV